jgi:hypothetical protein
VTQIKTQVNYPPVYSHVTIFVVVSARYETTISTDANGVAATAECDKKRKQHLINIAFAYWSQNE